VEEDDDNDTGDADGELVKHRADETTRVFVTAIDGSDCWSTLLVVVVVVVILEYHMLTPCLYACCCGGHGRGIRLSILHSMLFSLIIVLVVVVVSQQCYN